MDAAAGLTTLILVCIGSIAGGAGLSFVLTRAVFRRRLRHAQERMDHLQRVREQANELLMQARRQADMLSKELDLLRRQQVMPRHAAAAPAAAQPVRKPQAADDSGFRETVVNPVSPTGFFETQPYPQR